MDKQQIAQILDEMAVLSDLAGENPFKGRAYAKAARIVLEMTDDLNELVESGKLTSIDGIGDRIAEKITELMRTGKLKSYEKLRASIPDGVIEMLAIPGLGPKRARQIWMEGVTSVRELELMCTRHLLEKMPGFGRKMEEKILEGIESLKKYAGSWLLAEAYAEAAKLHKEIESWPETDRAAIAGSIRRHKEVVRDIDILVSTKKPAKVMEKFVALKGVEKVVQKGATKSEVILKSGIQCDLRAVTDAEYPFALYYFTGSKEHNVRMRSLAKDRGLKLSEYGLFKGDSKSSIACRDEAAIFRAFGLEYIEPELREDTGEIEAAAKPGTVRCRAGGKLPNLVQPSDIRGVVHVHTTYTDGNASLSDVAKCVRSDGYKYVVICDHSQAVSIAGGMKPEAVRRQHREIDRLNDGFKDFRIFKGIEVDILKDGHLDYDDELLSKFDVVIAAVHSNFNMDEATMTKRIVGTMSNPHVDILAHPTSRLLLAREAYHVDLKAVIDAAAEYGTAMEINGHPQRLDLDWRWCKYAKGKGVKISIGCDAHNLDGIGHTLFGVWTARKGWLEKRDVLNCLGSSDFGKHFERRAP